jgi:hypothetical protein
MRYELSDSEWTAIKPMLPNKPRGVRRVNDRRVLNERPDLLQPVSVSRAQPDRTVLQQDQAMSARRGPI